jgi:predicted nuclease of predicted toxin-antitoxin system
MSTPAWKFVIDEDMPRSTANQLRSVGYAVEDVRDIGLRGKDDRAILVYAQAQKACIITADLDFIAFARELGLGIPGLIVVRLPNHIPTWRLNDALLHTLQVLAGTDISELLVIVEAGRVRTRRLDSLE